MREKSVDGHLNTGATMGRSSVSGGKAKVEGKYVDKRRKRLLEEIRFSEVIRRGMGPRGWLKRRSKGEAVTGEVTER